MNYRETDIGILNKAGGKENIVSGTCKTGIFIETIGISQTIKAKEQLMKVTI